MGAYILVRPEAILVLLAFLIAMALYFWFYNTFLKKLNQYGWRYFQKIMLLVSISSIIFALLSLWRYRSFGQLFPQPAMLKLQV
ncbi:MAG: hypothetical protein SVR94_01740 [Pseudomonadota bacterium]|nr:hypothetical protein [Pseudomonadota bacterium]